MSAEARDFVARLLRKDPRARMPLSQVASHPWVVKNTADVATLSAGGAQPAPGMVTPTPSSHGPVSRIAPHLHAGAPGAVGQNGAAR